MRDIKFRGIRVGGGWAFGSLIKFDWGIVILDAGGFTKDEYTATRAYAHEVDPATVGQFTGLLDKNGVEIYEGDVCKVREDGNEYDPGTVHEVKYFAHPDEYPAFDFDPNYDEDANGIQSAIFGSSVEVISNIHDNPELLEG